MIRTTAGISALVILLAGSLCGQTLHINSITTLRQTGTGDNGYTLDGPMMSTSSRRKLLEPVNFSPSGTYHKPVEITDSYGTSGSLSQAAALPKDHIFFFGSFNQNDAYLRPFTPQELNDLYSWSKTGGKMIIACGQRYDGFNLNSTYLNSIWGFDWAYKNPSNFMATALGNSTDIFAGPFGNVSGAAEGGAVQGFFSKIPENSKVLATEQSGNPTLVLDCNTLDLWVADIDAFTVADMVNGGPNSVTQGPALNNVQDHFWVNTIVFMDKLQPLPEISDSSHLLTLNSTYNHYQWFRNNAAVSTSTTAELTATKSGDYYVETMVNGGCIVRSNTVTITIDSIIAPATPTCQVFVPTAFSPDGNSVNDELAVYGDCIKSLHFRVYDRWGELVFETTDRLQHWNGNYKGTAGNRAVFAWTLEATLESGEEINKKGSTVLVR